MAIGGNKMAKGRIIIDVDRCKGCALCLSYCPVNILELDNSIFSLRRISIDGNSEILGIFNFSGKKEIVRNPLWGYILIDLISQKRVSKTIELEPFGFHWYKIESKNI